MLSFLSQFSSANQGDESICPDSPVPSKEDPSGTSMEELQEVVEGQQRIISDQEKTIDEHQKTIRELEKTIRELKEELAHSRYGRSSEKRTVINAAEHPSADSPTGKLVPETVIKLAAALPVLGKVRKEMARAKKSAYRAIQRKHAAHMLPVLKEYTVLPTVGNSCPDCHISLGAPLKVETSRKLCALRPRVEQIVIHRLSSRCGTCNRFFYSTDEEEVFPKTQFDETFAAEVIVQKVLDGAPILRQVQGLVREGVIISEDSVEDLFIKAGAILCTVGRLQVESAQGSSILSVDDTRLRVRIEKPDGTLGYKNCALWMVASQTGEIGVIVTPDKKKKSCATVIGSKAKVILCDAASVNISVTAMAGLLLALCHAHARRKYVEAVSSDKELADEALLFSSALYAIEAKADLEGYSALERQELRNLEARPVLVAWKKWCIAISKSRPPDDKITKAVNYMLNNWAAFETYLDNGNISIDNNWIERCMKWVAKARKNFLHASSMEGARCYAIFCSLIFTCQNLGINPKVYLADVLRRAATTHHSQHAELLPINWLKLHSQEAYQRYNRMPIPRQQKHEQKNAA